MPFIQGEEISFRCYISASAEKVQSHSFFTHTNGEEEVRKRKGKTLPVFDVPLRDCQTTLCQSSQSYGWCWSVKPTLFKRLEKEGITR